MTKAQRAWHRRIDEEIVRADRCRSDWLTAARLETARLAYLQALQERLIVIDEAEADLRGR